MDNEESDLLNDDRDYDSSFDTDLVDWRPDELNPGPCLGENGFDGSDENSCDLKNGAVYDRGVFPVEN